MDTYIPVWESAYGNVYLVHTEHNRDYEFIKHIKYANIICTIFMRAIHDVAGFSV